ncbi:hypothetical protein ABK040_013566 [Willaertia magna]
MSIYCCDSINFKYLSNLTSLTNLSVSESEIEDKDLIELNNMKYLDVSYCTNLDTGIFLLNMNQLVHLECAEEEEALNKIEIGRLRNEIKKGNTFERAINYVINYRRKHNN